MLHAESFGDEDRAKVSCAFKFGGGERLQSVASYSIPAVLTDYDDVIDSHLPVLLSLSSMKRAQIKLDVENDSAEILGTTIPLNYTSSGHRCIPIAKTKVPVEEVCAVKLHGLSEQELRVDLDAVSGFHKAEGQEDVNIVMIPRSIYSE